MSDAPLQARIQRIEANVRGLHEKVAVLAAVDSAATKTRIAETFSEPRTVIIYRGIQRRMTQKQIADALSERSLKAAQQQRVSSTISLLEDLGFVERAPKGRFTPTPGWESFGLEKVLRKTLRDAKVNDLG